MVLLDSFGNIDMCQMLLQEQNGEAEASIWTLKGMAPHEQIEKVELEVQQLGVWRRFGMVSKLGAPLYSSSEKSFHPVHSVDGLKAAHASAKEVLIVPNFWAVVESHLVEVKIVLLI